MLRQGQLWVNTAFGILAAIARGSCGDICMVPVPSSSAAIAQLVARRSHNPKVVSSILTRRIEQEQGEQSQLTWTADSGLCVSFSLQG